MRLLTDKQIAKVKNPILQENWVDFEQYVHQVTKEERGIAKAQDKETLKAVGEKLENLLTHINSPKTNKRFVEALLRGEMPVEVK